MQSDLRKAYRFPSSKALDFGRNYLSLGSHFFQRGYLDQAGDLLQQALRDDPNSAEALYGIGSVYLNQNKNAEARAMFERCVTLEASYPTRSRMLGTILEFWRHAKGISPIPSSIFSTRCN